MWNQRTFRVRMWRITAWCFLEPCRKNPISSIQIAEEQVTKSSINHTFVNVLRNNTEDVKVTLAAMKKVLPKYQESIAMDMVPSGKSSPPNRLWWRHVSQHLLQIRQQLVVRRSNFSSRTVWTATSRAIVTTIAVPNESVAHPVRQNTSTGMPPSASIDKSSFPSGKHVKISSQRRIQRWLLVLLIYLF